MFDHSVIQRCQTHKLKNVPDKLPDDPAKTVTKKIRAACHALTAIIAEAQLEAPAGNWSTPTPALRVACARA